MKKPPLSRHLCPLAVCLSHPTTSWQPATCFTPLKSSQRNQSAKKKKKKKKSRQRRRRGRRRKRRSKHPDLNPWFNLLWQLCTHRWQCLSLFLCWSLTLSLSLFHTHKHTHTHTHALSPRSVCASLYFQPPPPPSLTLSLSLSTLFSLLLDPLPGSLLNRMSLRCTQEPCFYGSVSKQASQQDAVVQMSGGRSLTQPRRNSQTSSISLSLQSCCAKTPREPLQLLLQRALLGLNTQREGWKNNRRRKKKPLRKCLFAPLKKTHTHRQCSKRIMHKFWKDEYTWGHPHTYQSFSLNRCPDNTFKELFYIFFFFFFIHRMTLGKCVMRDQKGVFFFFFLDEQHMRACALFCVKRAAVMNTHTHTQSHTASRGAHRWFNKLWRKLHLSLQLWPWSCDILQHHQCNLRGKREEREGGVGGGWWMVDGGWWWWWGRESASPRVFPLSRLASVPQQAVVCRGCFCDRRAPTAGAPFWNQLAVQQGGKNK